MRKILGLCLGILALGALAQQDDTAAMRANNVAVIYMYQYVHAFAGKKDTCLYEITKMNTDAKTIYHSFDYTCSGYKTKTAEEYIYDKKRIAVAKEYRDGEPWSIATYFYKKRKDDQPKRVKVFYYQTNDSAEQSYTYFYSKKNRLDSTLTNMTLQDGSQIQNWTFAKYNKNNQVMQMYTTDSSYTPLQSVTYELGEEGVVESTSYQTYGEKADFSQIRYTYNADGKLMETNNQAQQRQVYVYDKNGLLTNMLSYNPNNELEVEYIYKYEYHK